MEFWSNAQYTTIYKALQIINAKLDKILGGEQIIMATANSLDAAIAALQTTVANETTVEQSAIKLITGIPALIAQAVADAQSKGATPEQLAALTALGSSITSSSASLADAVTANTPAA